ncbi:mitochondrial carrier domain-containing protein [Limtongia smithiae]|uniref:mitochondrial carrier domain-containing protein n=1 Tax=Limtongia smithiae TaxID=1125753 RepID=UPI0034CF97B1
MTANYIYEEGSLWRQIAAGALAGTAEVAITYPLEAAKIRSQLPAALRERVVGAPGADFAPRLRNIYTGCGTMVLGNVVRTSVRFGTYAFLSSTMFSKSSAESSSDSGSRFAAPKALAAGLGAGLMESIVLVPFEVAKVRQIASVRADSNMPPQGTLTAFRRLWQLHGPLGWMYGLLPTLARQGTTSAVRFTAYNTMRQAMESVVAPGERVSGTWSAALELAAIYAAVTITMPIDVVKTRMETLSGRQQAKGSSMYCTYLIFSQEGVTKLFAGLMPRLLRVSIASMLMVSLYESAFKAVSVLDRLVAPATSLNSSEDAEQEGNR